MGNFQKLDELQAKIKNEELDDSSLLEGLTALEYRKLLEQAVECENLRATRAVRDCLVGLLNEEPPGDEEFVSSAIRDCTRQAFDERCGEIGFALFESGITPRTQPRLIKDLFHHGYKEEAVEFVKENPGRFSIELLRVVNRSHNIGDIAPVILRTLRDRNDDYSGYTKLGRDLASEGCEEGVRLFVEEGFTDCDGALMKAVSFSNDRETIEYLFEEADMGLSDLPESKIEKAAQSGHNETIRTLLDRGYEPTDDVLGAMTSTEDENEPLEGELVLRLYDEFLKPEKNRGFNAWLFENPEQYDKDVRCRALESYTGEAIFFSAPEQVKESDARRLLERRKVRKPHELVRTLVQSAENPEKKRRELVEELGALRSEEIVIAAIYDRNAQQAAKWVKQLDPEQKSEAAAKFLKHGWSHGTDRPLATYWDIYRRDNQAEQHLPMTVVQMALHAAALYQKTGAFKRLLDETSADYSTIPERALRHFMADEPDCSPQVAGRASPDVTDLYEHAREQGDQAHSYIREAFGERPIEEALEAVMWKREVRKLLRAGAQFPDGNDDLLFEALGSDNDLFREMLKSTDHIPDELFIRTLLHKDRESFETLLDHYCPDQAVVTEALNRLIASSTAENIRLNWITILEKQQDFTMDWSFRPDQSGPYQRMPLSFVAQYNSDINDQISDEDNDTHEQILATPIVEQLLALGADPSAHDGEPLHQAVGNEDGAFDLMAQAVGGDLEEYPGLIKSALEGEAMFICELLEQLIEKHNINPNYEGGIILKYLAERKKIQGLSDKEGVVRTLLEQGLDPTTKHAREALRCWINRAGTRQNPAGSPRCTIVRMLLQEQRERGDLKPPEPQAFPDTPGSVLDVVCEELPPRQARSLRVTVQGQNNKQTKRS